MKFIKNFIPLIILAFSPFGHAAPPESSDIIKALRLADNRAEFRDVTELESSVRGIRFYSVKLLSIADKDPTFFPLIIYTAPKGQINSAKYDALKAEFRSTPPENRSGFGETMGFIIDGTDEVFVFFDSVKIASHRPAIPGVVAPLEPRTETGVSIVGTLESTGMDFQIFLIGPSNKQADLYPDYKRYLESLTNFKAVGKEIYTSAKAAKLLESNPTTGVRQPKSRGVGSDDTAGKSSGKAGAPPTQSGKGWQEAISTGNFWLWILLATVIALPLLVLALRRAKQ